jgi:hypothetical protein
MLYFSDVRDLCLSRHCVPLCAFSGYLTNIKNINLDIMPRGLTRRSTAVRLLRSWVRISPGAWMFVCCVCCVLSGRGLCDKLYHSSKRNPTDCDASLCVIKKPCVKRRP